MMAATENNVSNNIETSKTFSESSAILQAQQKLDSCAQYFLFWLGDSEFDKIAVENFSEALNEKQKEVDETLNTLNTKEKIEKKKSNDNANDGSDQMDAGDYSSNARPSNDNTDLEAAVSLLVYCFLKIHVGEIDLAKKIFVESTNYMKSISEANNSLKEFVPGFDFLKLLLEIHLKVKENSHDVNEQISSSSFGIIDELSDNGKAMIYATKWRFLELAEGRRQDSLDALRNVARLNHSGWNWQYILCMRLRFLRRQSLGSITYPDEEEIQASTAAFQMSEEVGGKHHAMARAGLSQTISEILKYRLTNNCPNTPIHFGELTFGSNEAIIKYLKREARNALTRFPRIYFGEFMRYSEIFSSALPREHRNYEIAILCMTFCLRIMPKNSKANHKMGVLYLVGDEDIKEAIPFFRKAVQFEPKNYPAWMDLIPSLLQSHADNDEELETIFNTIYNTSWLENQTVSLKFLHGCYLFMKGEKHAAIDIWVSAYNSSDDSDERRERKFFHLSALKRRYLWPHAAVKLNEVEIALNEIIQSTNSFNKGLNALKEEIASVLQFSPRDRQNTQYVHGASRMSYTHSDVNDNSQWRQSNTPNTGGSQWRESNRNSSATTDSRWRQPNTDNQNYYYRNGNSSSRYYAMQRQRSPSPKSWRK